MQLTAWCDEKQLFIRTDKFIVIFRENVSFILHERMFKPAKCMKHFIKWWKSLHRFLKKASRITFKDAETHIHNKIKHLKEPSFVWNVFWSGGEKHFCSWIPAHSSHLCTISYGFLLKYLKYSCYTSPEPETRKWPWVSCIVQTADMSGRAREKNMKNGHVCHNGWLKMTVNCPNHNIIHCCGKRFSENKCVSQPWQIQDKWQLSHLHSHEQVMHE